MGGDWGSSGFIKVIRALFYCVQKEKYVKRHWYRFEEGDLPSHDDWRLNKTSRGAKITTKTKNKIDEEIDKVK